MAHRMNPNRNTENNPIFTKVAVVLIAIAAGIMLYLYLIHKDIPGDEAWSKYALMMSIFALVGYFMTQTFNRQHFFPKNPNEFKTMDLNTGMKAAIIFAASLVTQIISNAAFTFSTDEQALYFVFAAVCEEVFFRVFLISFFLTFLPPLTGNESKFQEVWRAFPAILIQAVMFAAIHQNYYNNIPMLISVGIGGFILGIFYVVWQDATANILAHLGVNLYAIQNLYAKVK